MATLLHPNFANYLGQAIGLALPALEEKFTGNVVVYQPGQVPDENIQPSRLKVFIDDAGLITKIING